MPGFWLALMIGLSTAADDTERIALIGNAFFEHEYRDAYLETEITRRAVGRKVRFRNLGWSGDTVLSQARSYFGPPAEGRARLLDSIKLANPTKILLYYGANESYAGEAARATFQANYQQLVSEIRSISKAELTLISPAPVEPFVARNQVLASQPARAKQYRELIGQIAIEGKAKYFDFAGDLESQAVFSESMPLTTNGIHFHPFGYWRLAPVFASPLGNIENPRPLVINYKSEKKPDGLGLPIKLQHQRKYLPRAKPPAAARADSKLGAETLIVRDLPAGQYRWRSGQEVIAEGSAADWATGIEIQRGPDFSQAEELRKTIIEKNQLFFHRWRPQNETYIFGFRKHEQGNNAVEIPQFDPLIEAKEAEIDKLKIPRPHEYVFEKIPLEKTP